MNLAKKLFSSRMELKLREISNESVVARKLLTFVDRSMNINFTRCADLTDDPKMVSYLPKGKECHFAFVDGVVNGYSPTGRQTCKIGKFINTWANEFAINFYDKDVEIFVNALSAQSKEQERYQIVSGPDIIKYYLGRNNDDTSTLGTLTGSCMKEIKHSPYIKFYAMNSHRVKMLILFSDRFGKEELIIGRALLWKTNKGFTFMDRVYGSDVTIEQFKKYARKKGFYHKEGQNRMKENFIAPDGTSIFPDDVYITDLHLPTQKVGVYPYFDTFKYIYHMGIAATVRSFYPGIWAMGECQNTNGQVLGKEMVFVRSKNLYFNKDSTVVGLYDYYSKLCENILSNEAFSDPILNKIYHFNNVVLGPEGETYVKGNPNICQPDGDNKSWYVPIQNARRNVFDGKTYIIALHSWRLLRYKSNSAGENGALLEGWILEINLKAFLEANNYSLEPDGITIVVEKINYNHINAVAKPITGTVGDKKKPLKQTIPDVPGQSNEPTSDIVEDALEFGSNIDWNLRGHEVADDQDF